MFDLLAYPGLPVDRHGRHWHELDVEPIDAAATDSYTRCRIRTMQALEAAAALFDRQMARRPLDADARRSVGSLGESAAERRRHLAALRPPAADAAQDALGYERAALDLVTWVASSEPEPDRSMAYQHEAWQHLQRLRWYAEMGVASSDRIVAEVEDLWPAAAPESATMRQRPSARPGTRQGPMSLLHDWAVQAVHQQVAEHHQLPPARQWGNSWERLVVHEAANCYLYYSFLAEETDRRLKPLWELHLQMELAHLRLAGDLLRRHTGHDPQEVVGTGLPEPVTLASSGRHRRDWAAGAGTGRDGGELDLLDLLTEQHARIKDLCERTIRAEGDRSHTAFGELVRLVAVHEVTEEEIVHPLTRRLDPDAHLAEHMFAEERQISEALEDAVRADAAGDPGRVVGPLRDMVLAHARDEERDEFPYLRRMLPEADLPRLTGAARAAAEAAASPGAEPAAAGPRTVRQTAERARDALHTLT